MKKPFILISAAIACVLSMTACGSVSEGQSTDTEQTTAAAETTEAVTEEVVESTPIDELTDGEKKVYEAMLVNINSFYSPQEARLLEIKGFSTMTEYDFCYIKINSKNKLGGNLSENYCLWLNDVTDDNGTHKFGDIDKEPDSFWNLHADLLMNPDDTISRINKALEYYWSEKGL